MSCYGLSSILSSASSLSCTTDESCIPTPPKGSWTTPPPPPPTRPHNSWRTLPVRSVQTTKLDLAWLRTTYLPSPGLGLGVLVKVGLGPGLASGKGWAGTWVTDYSHSLKIFHHYSERKSLPILVRRQARLVEYRISHWETTLRWNLLKTAERSSCKQSLDAQNIW